MVLLDKVLESGVVVNLAEAQSRGDQIAKLIEK